MFLRSRVKIFPLVTIAYCLSLFLMDMAYAYLPPIGIPSPAFGITESVQNIYGSENYFTHYIDNTQSAATDTGNPYGSVAKPRRTIPITLSAGDVVLIKAGTYATTRDRFSFSGHGTREKPIFIRGANASSKPVLIKPVHLADVQWLIFENINIQTENGGLEVRPQLSRPVSIHHVSIRYCEMIGNGKYKSGQSFGFSSSVVLPPVSDVVFYKNVSRDAGKWDAPDEDDTHAFAIGSNVQNAWILDNTAYRSGGDGIQVAHAAIFSTHHIYIGRNTFYQHRENGVDLKQANDVIVSENIIYRHRPTASSSGEGIVIHYGPRRVWILFNTIYDSEFGVVTTGSQDTYIIGNVISAINLTRPTHKPGSPYSPGAAIHARNAKEIHILNNTLYGYTSGIQIASGGPAHIENNIFSNRTGQNGYDINHVGNFKDSTLDHNLFYPGAAAVRLKWGGNTALTLKQLRSKFPKLDLNSLEGNPRFQNAAKRDFRLTTESAALNAGPTSINSLYATYASLYGAGILKDLENKNRPLNGRWDIGAFELETSAATPEKNRTHLPGSN